MKKLFLIPMIAILVFLCACALAEDTVTLTVGEKTLTVPVSTEYVDLDTLSLRDRNDEYEKLDAFIAALPDLCQSLFGKRFFSELNDDEQKECVRQIRFRFSAHVNQIARVCGLSYAVAARLIDGA